MRGARLAARPATAYERARRRGALHVEAYFYPTPRRGGQSDGLGSQPDASKEISGELLLGYNRMMADGAPAGGGCGERTNG